ncbi:hypothetical protein ACSSS7_007832 [Eimeria intestinalis]
MIEETAKMHHTELQLSALCLLSEVSLQLFAETPLTHPLCRDAVAAAEAWQQSALQQQQQQQQQHVPRRQQQGRLKAGGLRTFTPAWMQEGDLLLEETVDAPRQQPSGGSGGTGKTYSRGRGDGC